MPELFRLDEFNWSTMEMRYLTCINHPKVRLLTKNPYERSIFSIVEDEKCDCDFYDLRVVAE